MDNHDTKNLTGKPGPQWDISQTAFNSAGALRDLIRAVTYDDVQPQALLAAEALGLGLLISPVRTNEAIQALDGNESVKWDNFKVLLGLRAKGTVKTIRNSTALTQFFLVVSACKLCYTDAELGDLFFDMISESGVLKVFPVASTQLTRLIGALSGHSDRIIPVQLMHDLAVAVDGCSGNPAFYHRLENAKLATLICKLFEYLRDDSVEYVSLTGCLSGLWLATAFLWLLPDQTSITVDGELLKGSKLAKLTINLTKELEEVSGFETKAWRMQAWRSEGGPTTFIVESKHDLQQRTVSEIPTKLAKSVMHHSYGLPGIDPDGTRRRGAIEAIGQLARALITYTTENGHIYVAKRCCSDSMRRENFCSRATLMCLQKEDWIESYADAISDYGWDEHPVASARHSSALDVIQNFFAGKKLEDMPDAEIFKVFNQTLLNWARETSNDQREDAMVVSPHAIIEYAFKIAEHAISSSMCIVESGNLKLGISTSNRTFNVLENSLIARLLSRRGLETGQLRLSALSCIFPYASPSLNDLMISQDGLVAGWWAMWEPKTAQRPALLLKVLRGNIQKQNFRYDKIQEPYIEGSGSQSKCHRPIPINLFDLETYTGLNPQRETHHLSTKFVCSVVGNCLEVQTLLMCRDEAGEEDCKSLSWISAISHLAGATHVERSGAMSRLQEEAIARILHNKPLEAYWVSGCHNNVAGMTREKNIVLRTLGSEELRFWAVAALAQRSGLENCLSLIVRHSGALISSVNIASKSKAYWAVIC